MVRITRGFAKRYVGTFAAIGLLATVMWLDLTWRDLKHRKDSEVIKLASGQDTLAHQIILSAHRLASANNPATRAEARSRLLEAADGIEETENALLDGEERLGLPSELAEFSARILREGSDPIDGQIRRFVAAARSLAARADAALSEDDLDLAYVVGFGAANLVKSLDVMTARLQRREEGANRYEEAQRTVAWLLIMALLLSTALLVFRPMEQRIRSTIRELQAAKESSAASEARYRSLYNRTPAMLCSIDDAGRIVSVSDYWLEFSGYRADEVVGRQWSDFLTQGSRGAMEVAHPRSLRSGICSGVDYRFIKKDGRTVDVLLSAVAEHDEGDHTAGALVVLVDVTSHKRAERVLRRRTEATRLLRAIACAANEATTVEDALEAAIRHIVEFQKWPVGHAFLVAHEPTRLVSTGFWHLADSERFRPFRELTESMTWEPGVGLPGRVLADGRPAWTVDITEDPDCARKGPLGLKGGFAFPIRVADETIAVLEFFSAEAADADDELLEMVANIGVTLGRTVERWRAQEMLRKEGNFISAVLDTAAALVFVLDRNGRIVQFNKACETLTGYHSIEVLDRPIWDFLIAPEQVDSVRELFAGFASAQLSSEHESLWVTKDGERRWIGWSSSCLLDDEGAVEHVIGTGIDLTERKAVDRHIRELARFPDENPNPVIRVATDGSVLYANRVAQALGLLLDDGGALALRPPLDALVQESVAPDKPQEIEPTLGDRTFAFELIPIPASEYVNIYGRDTTERSPYLLQAQKMQAIGQLTGGVAHDFNNLLTVILGNLQLIKRAAQEDERLQRRVAKAEAAAARAAELTRRLLAYTRQQVLEPQVVDVNELLAGMEVLIRQTLDATVGVEIHLAPDLCLTRVDPNQLETAILNLIVNARDACGDSGGQLTIETANARLDEDYVRRRPYAVPGDFLMIAVTDTGSGMPPEIVARVFEPFFTTKEVGKGTGLGLSMIYGFIKQSGGYVDIYSEVGHGTTVRLYLPDAGPATSWAAAAGEDGPTLVGASGNETILLVEDQEEVRDIAVAVLRDLDYQVVEADNGPNALAALERHPEVDLLFTDVVMPGGMNGAELAEAASRRQPGLKVLFASGYPENAITAGGALKPGAHYLAKPYQRDVLASKLREVLDGQPASAA